MSQLLLIILITFTVVLLAGLITILFFIRHAKKRGQITRSLNTALFLITLPSETLKEGEENQQKMREIVSVMEQVYSSFSNVITKGKRKFIYGAPAITFEIAMHHIGEEIYFYFASPKNYADTIKSQIQSFFPEAVIEEVSDYNIFNPKGATAASSVVLRRPGFLPVKTYQKLEADPLNAITNAMSKLDEAGEGAVVQFIIRPAKPQWKKLGLKIAKEMKQGKTFEWAYRKASRGIILQTIFTFSEALSPTSKDEETKQLTPLEEELVKSVEEKASKLAFETNIRLIASATEQTHAENILRQLETAFNQFDLPSLNGFRIRKATGKQMENLIYNFAFRIFDKKQQCILNTEELTSVFHFPTATVETPKIKLLKAKPSEPPADIPKEGLIIGTNIYRGEETVIRITKNDRRRHLYVIGQTGTGKSYFQRSLIRQDIINGDGVCYIDPHGSDIEEILEMIPKERVEDVVYFNPADLERPMGLNFLEYDPAHPEQKTSIVNELLEIFETLFNLKASGAGGPMFEQYMRNSVQLIMDDPAEKATLLDVPRVFANEEYRRRLLDKCQNIIVKEFWEKEAEQAGGEASLANMVPYITSKFNVFIANDYMRPIVGQPESSLNFRRIMDEKKILLVNLSKGRLGELNAHLLGLIIVGKLSMAAMSRVDIPEEQRNDFYLYIDEFQNVTTPSIASILSEARKYRLCLTIAHQYIGQLPDDIKNAVFGNVGSIVSFRVGADDAEFLIKQFEPVFSPNDLINIANFNAHIKLMLNNQTSKPFTMQPIPFEKGSPEIAKAVKDLSALKYGKERKVVEQEIRAKYNV